MIENKYFAESVRLYNAFNAEVENYKKESNSKNLDTLQKTIDVASKAFASYFQEREKGTYKELPMQTELIVDFFEHIGHASRWIENPEGYIIFNIENAFAVHTGYTKRNNREKLSEHITYLHSIKKKISRSFCKDCKTEKALKAIQSLDDLIYKLEPQQNNQQAAAQPEAAAQAQPAAQAQAAQPAAAAKPISDSVKGDLSTFSAEKLDLLLSGTLSDEARNRLLFEYFAELKNNHKNKSDLYSHMEEVVNEYKVDLHAYLVYMKSQQTAEKPFVSTCLEELVLCAQIYFYYKKKDHNPKEILQLLSGCSNDEMIQFTKELGEASYKSIIEDMTQGFIDIYKNDERNKEEKKEQRDKVDPKLLRFFMASLLRSGQIDKINAAFLRYWKRVKFIEDLRKVNECLIANVPSGEVLRAIRRTFNNFSYGKQEEIISFTMKEHKLDIRFWEDKDYE